MATAELTLSTILPNFLETSTADEQLLSEEVPADQQRQEQWQRLIDHTLIEWANSPPEIEVDGLEPPTREAISAACRVARILCESGWPAMRAVPNGDGGIALEYTNGPHYIVIEIESDLSYEIRRYDGSKRIHSECGVLPLT